MGRNVLDAVTAGGLVGVTGGASLGLLGRDGKRSQSQQTEVSAPGKSPVKRTLLSGKDRKERLGAARGRQSLRIQLATTEAGPRPTRGGLSIVGT